MTTLTPDEIMQLNLLFGQIAPVADMVAHTFYERLFVIDPKSKGLFVSTDMQAQSAKLMQTLAAAIASADRLDEIQDDLYNLGRRHIAYGITAAQYDSVGEALVWAMEETLQEGFTPEMRGAWQKVYDIIASIAKKAYKHHEQ